MNCCRKHSKKSNCCCNENLSLENCKNFPTVINNLQTTSTSVGAIVYADTVDGENGALPFEEILIRPTKTKSLSINPENNGIIIGETGIYHIFASGVLGDLSPRDGAVIEVQNNGALLKNMIFYLPSGAIPINATRHNFSFSGIYNLSKNDEVKLVFSPINSSQATISEAQISIVKYNL